MTDARDELVDLIEHAAYIHHNQAKVIVDALTARFGEPKIEERNFPPVGLNHSWPGRRLVFPWQTVKEAGE